MERIFQLCSIFNDHELVSIEPFRIEFELKDYTINDYDLDIVKRIAAISKDTKFGFNCSLIHVISDDSNDIKDLISDITLSEVDDFITCQVMATACGRAGLNEQALEWGNKAQVMLKSLFEISGNPYLKYVN